MPVKIEAYLSSPSSLSDNTTEGKMVKIEAYSSPTSSSSDNTMEGRMVRRCTQCSSEKTTQRRTGSLVKKWEEDTLVILVKLKLKKVNLRAKMLLLKLFQSQRNLVFDMIMSRSVANSSWSM
nr:GATA transcription factor 2 [Tanacetum cinerariifolium]